MVSAKFLSEVFVSYSQTPIRQLVIKVPTYSQYTVNKPFIFIAATSIKQPQPPFGRSSQDSPTPILAASKNVKFKVCKEHNSS